MQKIFIITGSLLGATAVMIGAFGAHALRKMLEASGRSETFETAVKYQFYHAIALVLVGIIMFHVNHRWLTYSGYSFIGGVLIFSGSLYLLCFTGITKFGMITPIGGLLMIIGWLLLAGAVAKGM
ncbi:MAG: DUF423 domain-containing protein [Cyclobacteriaceae bacterium]|nr:DUF423 domain-containing protein [Cyclobacteriaceae bacterium]